MPESKINLTRYLGGRLIEESHLIFGEVQEGGGGHGGSSSSEIIERLKGLLIKTKPKTVRIISDPAQSFGIREEDSKIDAEELDYIITTLRKEVMALGIIVSSD